MASSSPSVLVKRLEADINLIFRKIRLDKLESKDQKSLATLRQALGDARIYISDYELSEMRDEQLGNAKKANKYLEQVRQCILKTSERNVFTPIEVAHLSAQIDQIKAGLK